MVKTGLKFAGGSDMGRVRKNNEDAWHIDAERGIFLVVDGIGGHAAGEKAPSSVEFVDGEKRDRDVEAPVPPQARIGLAGVVFLDFRSGEHG